MELLNVMWWPGWEGRMGGEWICVFCCRSVTKSSPTLLDLVDCSIPGFPVPHHLPEFAQVHVH